MTLIIYTQKNLSRNQQDYQTFWMKTARRLEWKINIGWILEKSVPPLVIGAVLLTGFILITRYYSSSYSLNWGLGALILGLLITLAIGVWRALRHFEKNSLTRLESHLNIQLTSANAGISEWPPEPKNVTLPLSWNYQRIALPLLGCFAICISALFLPLPERKATLPIAAPRQWQALNQQLNELKEEELVEQEYVEELQKKLEQLQAQKEEDWYKHSSLEAGESLNQEHQNNLAEASEALNQASEALQALTESANLTQTQQDSLQEQLQKAAQAMQDNALRPNEALREQIQKFGQNQMEGLNKEQVEQLKQNMGELEKQLLSQQQGQNPGENPSKEGGDGEPGNGERKPPIDPNTEFGTDIDGPTNRNLGEEADEYKAQKDLALQSQDLSKSVPGELFDISIGEHEIDLSATSQSTGQGTKNVGQGGSTTWKGNYLPNEKRALKNFFK